MEKIKIDKLGRIVIPKVMRKMLNIEPETELGIDINSSKGCIMIFRQNDWDIKKAIQKRLKKTNDPTEIKFLNGLLEKY